MSELPAFSKKTLTLVVGVLSLETLALFTASGLLLYSTVTQPASSLSSALFLDLTVVVFALGLTWVTWGVWQGKPSARSGALVWQVLQMGLAISGIRGPLSEPVLAAVVGGPAVLVITLLLFSPSLKVHFAAEEGETRAY